MKRILVTGGAGYIGSHTTKLLLRSGFQAVVFDNLSKGHAEAVPHCPLVRGDLADRELLRKTLREREIEAVVHFAASAYVGESVVNPRAYFENNVSNSLNLLNAMLDTGVRTLVLSSTCATYGDPETLPISESHPQKPVNPYGESKLFVERAMRWYGEAYGLRWCALRYFNAAGADPEGELGEVHDPETHLIPLVIQAARGDRAAIAIFGTDYPTPDGTAVRDYVHVNDLASAHVAALSYLDGGGPGVALNLGTGNGHSVREVVKQVERTSGKAVPVVESARRPGDPAILVADAAKAGAVLGWKPVHSSLDSIVETAWRWEEKRPRWQ
jgi:UDP-arabinose 4-epimerase